MAGEEPEISFLLPDPGRLCGHDTAQGSQGEYLPGAGHGSQSFRGEYHRAQRDAGGHDVRKGGPGQTGSPETEEIGNFCRRRYKERLYCVDIINTGKQFGRLPRVQIIWTPRMVFTQGKEFPV